MYTGTDIFPVASGSKTPSTALSETVWLVSSAAIMKAGQLQPQRFIFSQLWRLEVPDQGPAGRSSCEGCLPGLLLAALLLCPHKAEREISWVWLQDMNLRGICAVHSPYLSLNFSVLLLSGFFCINFDFLNIALGYCFSWLLSFSVPP